MENVRLKQTTIEEFKQKIYPYYLEIFSEKEKIVREYGNRK